MATKKTTALAPRASTSLVSLQERLQQQLKEMATRVLPESGNRIQVTQDKSFKFPDGTRTETFEAIIVDFVSVNLFYEKSFDPKQISPPACFSISLTPTNMVPSPRSPKRQAEACTGCPMNEFGSKNDGKACKNTRLLALMSPDAKPEDPLLLLSISPTGTKAFDSYVRSVASVFMTPPIGVVTTFKFDEHLDYPSVRCSEPKQNENLTAAGARMDEARELLLVEPDVSSFEAASAKPAARRVASRMVR
jgi:hypothetical protein